MKILICIVALRILLLHLKQLRTKQTTTMTAEELKHVIELIHRAEPDQLEVIEFEVGYAKYMDETAEEQARQEQWAESAWLRHAETGTHEDIESIYPTDMIIRGLRV